MIVVQGEITNPLDKVAIAGQLVGLDMERRIVDEDINRDGDDEVCLYLEFNVDSEAATFWSWIKNHGKSGGGAVRKHTCSETEPCTIDEEVVF